MNYVPNVVPAAYLVLGLLFVNSVESILADVEAPLTPHPALGRTTRALTKQLGDFGESFVGAGLRVRGFKVFDGNIGVNGIDRFAVKYSADGELTDIRFIEVKTRQITPDFGLAMTKRHGPQLSKQWIRHHLRRIIAEHPDDETRRVASEIVKRMKTHPQIVRRELHGIAVGSNRYIVRNVDDAGRVTGIAADGRLTSLLQGLSRRGVSAETRMEAVRHLAQFDQLKGIAKIPRASYIGRIPRAMPRTSRAIMAVTGGTARAGSATLKTVGKVLGPADLMFVGYQSHIDWQRYSSGDVHEGMLAIKFALRGGEVAIAILLISPEPTSKVILVGIAASLILVGTDTSLDAVIDVRNNRRQKLLENINREERFHVVRGQLANELKALRIPAASVNEMP